MTLFGQKKRVGILSAFLLSAGILGWLLYVWRFQGLPQSAIYLLEEIPAPDKEDRILVFAPHPDDETIAVGGYIASAVQTGASVWIVLVTNGNKHGKELIRYQEFRKASAILGIPESNLFFLGYPDGGLKKQNGEQIRHSFEKIILQVQPNIIFAPHSADLHWDHKITGKIAEELNTGKGRKLYQYLVHYNRYPKPRGLHHELYLLPPLRLVRFSDRWKNFELSPEIEDQKLEAVLQYRSQLGSRRDPLLRGLLLGLIRKNELFATPIE